MFELPPIAISRIIALSSADFVTISRGRIGKSRSIFFVAGRRGVDASAFVSSPAATLSRNSWIFTISTMRLAAFL